jgi:hypothetical protein
MVCWLGILLRAALLWSCLWGRRLESFRRLEAMVGCQKESFSMFESFAGRNICEMRRE